MAYIRATVTACECTVVDNFEELQYRAVKDRIPDEVYLYMHHWLK